MRRTDALEAVVLSVLRSDTPVGARTIWRQALRKGFDISESTVSRVLNDLDSRGLTVALDNKGRALTTAGEAMVQSAMAEERRRRQFDGARTIRSAEELLDLMAVRRSVELVAARSAALRATPAEIMRLQVMSEGEEDPNHPDLWSERIGFHKYIGHLSHNKPVQAITEAIFEDKFDLQERIIFQIGRISGTWAESTREHHLIAQAIANREPDLAERLMLAHLDRLIREVENYLRTESKEKLERLFTP